MFLSGSGLGHGLRARAEVRGRGRERKKRKRKHRGACDQSIETAKEYEVCFVVGVLCACATAIRATKERNKD